MLPHVPSHELPGQALACELSRQRGVRSVEIGTLMFGRTDRATGRPVPATHDLLRLCLPRRVYTQSHIDWVIESFAMVHERRERIRGLQIVALAARSAPSLGDAAVAYCELMRQHIANEDNVLFPMAKNLLDHAAIQRLRQGFANVEHHDMGDGTHCKYEELGHRLANGTVAVDV